MGAYADNQRQHPRHAAVRPSVAGWAPPAAANLIWRSPSVVPQNIPPAQRSSFTLAARPLICVIGGPSRPRGRSRPLVNLRNLCNLWIVPGRPRRSRAL